MYAPGVSLIVVFEFSHYDVILLEKVLGGISRKMFLIADSRLSVPKNTNVAISIIKGSIPGYDLTRIAR